MDIVLRIRIIEQVMQHPHVKKKISLHYLDTKRILEEAVVQLLPGKQNMYDVYLNPDGKDTVWTVRVEIEGEKISILGRFNPEWISGEFIYRNSPSVGVSGDDYPGG
jgi:hypothetical protein